MVARKRATLDWLVARLSTSSKKRKKKKYITGQFSRRFLPPSLPLLPLSLSLSLSCPLSFLSPFWHPSSCPTIAPTYEHRLCINEHAPPPASYYPHPSIGCNGYPCTTLRPAADRRYFTRRFPSAVFLRVPFSNAL